MVCANDAGDVGAMVCANDAGDVGVMVCANDAGDVGQWFVLMMLEMLGNGLC